MNRKVIASALITFVAMLASGVAQSQTAADLHNFLSSLEQPVQQLTLTFPSNPARDKLWTNPTPATDTLPDAAKLAEFANELKKDPADQGVISAIDKNKINHDFGSLVGTMTSTGTVGAGTTVVGTNNTATVSCAQAASSWHTEVGGGGRFRQGQPSIHTIVFDQRGVVCARVERTTRITQGDILYVGLYGPPDEITPLRRKIPTCSLEGTAPNILDTTTGIAFTSGTDDPPVLRKLPPFECFDDEIEIQFLNADNSVAFTNTLRQYKRYRATYQIGALWTSLADPNYTLTDFGSGNVIRSTVDDSKGPEYMASLVIYGAPHYLSSLTRSGRYSGRDIVNENSFADRVGLFLAFGLSDPKDTLGVGLSFELASGVNLTVTQLYRRMERLDTVMEGDAFSGTVEQIPTRKTWEDEVAIGLSIDGRYLAKFFGGDSKD